jgi:dienelactone hydrolase
VTVLPLVDRRRWFVLARHRREPRKLTTYVYYPEVSTPSATGGNGRPPSAAPGPHPLLVFAHGFDGTPASYASLLHYWASAGFVVAAPLFPRTNPHSPGGPDEADVVNQPADISFVISNLLALDADSSSPLHALIDAGRIAVAGHSDGAETALAVADARRLRDPRVRAGVIMSGAEMSGIGGYSFTGGPPLVAIQGTADTLNEPRFTYAFFNAARPPKYMLKLLGATHLAPYTSQQPQLRLVERATTAFLAAYLAPVPMIPKSLLELGTASPFAKLSADP